jgi:exosome complex RNA-binding protein Rrp4
MQLVTLTLSRVLLKAGSSIAARIAIIDITTSNSINVNSLHIKDLRNGIGSHADACAMLPQ